MLTLGYAKFARRLVESILFRLFRLVFCGIQNAYWKLNGTSEHLRKVRGDPSRYEQSAHVVDVVMFHTFCELQSTRPRDFIYVHNRFDSPQYIIDNDHVSLFYLDGEGAVFVEAKEKGLSTINCSVDYL